MHIHHSSLWIHPLQSAPPQTVRGGLIPSCRRFRRRLQPEFLNLSTAQLSCQHTVDTSLWTTLYRLHTVHGTGWKSIGNCTGLLRRVPTPGMKQSYEPSFSSTSTLIDAMRISCGHRDIQERANEPKLRSATHSCPSDLSPQRAASATAFVFVTVLREGP